MMKCYQLYLICMLMLCLALPALGQGALTDKDVQSIRIGARRSIANYQIIMNSLADPNNNQPYIVDEYLAEARNYFTDSALIENDYELRFAPPNLPSEVVVDQYLRDFYLFYQKKTLNERIKVYFDLLDVSDVAWFPRWDTHILTVTFSSAYGTQLPQQRVATFRADKQAGEWKVRMTYIKFKKAKEEDMQIMTQTVALPEWQVLAKQAEDALNEDKLVEAHRLLQQSLALDSTAINLKLIGQYYDRQDSLEQSLEHYLMSLEKGQQADSLYNDSLTVARIRQLNVRLQALQLQQIAGSEPQDEGQVNLDSGHQEPAAVEEETAQRAAENTAVATETADAVSIIALNKLAGGGKRGKTYRIDWTLEESQTVDIALAKGGKSQTIKEDYYANKLDLRLNKKLKPGRYSIKLLDEQGQTTLGMSRPFMVRRKFPMVLRVGLAAAVGGYLYYAYQHDVFPFPEKKVVPPTSKPEINDIPEPYAP